MYFWSQGGHFPWASYFRRRQPTRSQERKGCDENETSHKYQGSAPILRHVWVLPQTCSIFAKVATPLTNLTRSNTVFAWTEKCQSSFEHLKNSLVRAPILVKAQVDRPFILTTDASDTHVGGVLSQLQSDGANKPVGYY